jgi:L-alanine-DL-glutamate epimerase-like enolase superfamily enzyme
MRKPTTTTAPTGQTPPFGLRLLPDLKTQVMRAAAIAGRSMNAEIVHRITQSFEGGAGSLPQCVQDAVEDEIEARGGTPEEALTRLVLAGQSRGGTVFQVTLQPGTKLQDMKDLLEAARHVIPPDADILVDRQ